MIRSTMTERWKNNYMLHDEMGGLASAQECMLLLRDLKFQADISYYRITGHGTRDGKGIEFI